jgi:DNA-binding NtrC family response regulator
MIFTVIMAPLKGNVVGLISPSDLAFVRAVSQLNYANPFLPERLELERAALGDEFRSETGPFWSFTPTRHGERRSNLVKLLDRASTVARLLRAQLIAGAQADDEQLALYDDLVLYILFYELLDDWGNRGAEPSADDDQDRRVWKRYSAEFDYWLKLPQRNLPSAGEMLHLFAMFRQIYRAFFQIFECVIGESLPAAQLRAKIWQSIFTHDLRRYRRSLYRTLPQVTTLVTGPTGSGKELVAQAIGLSCYIPFDPRQGKFATEPSQSYFAINISAFSRNLVESELFGHAKGAFTDAAQARAGWLEACGPQGAILLDEIGELDPATQVKLLRVLQNRQFQRLGETKQREFHGKIIAATNRDLRREIETGSFREDLYYRLCSDVIETPSLAAQVQDNPEVLENLVTHLAARIAPSEAETLTQEVVIWLRARLPGDYAWPGNIRELEQCVRNILVRGEYTPSTPSASSPVGRSDCLTLAEQMESLNLTADELLSRYCRMAYRRTKSFEKAARLLQLDRRTVRAKVDLLAASEQAPEPEPNSK